MDYVELVPQVEAPQPTATMVDRLKYLLDLSHRTQAQFSRLIGLDPSSMSRLLSGRMKITEQYVNRLVANLGVSKSWFMKGEGVPFPRANDSAPGLVHANTTAIDSSRPKGAPVYDIDATAGAMSLSRAFTQEHIVGYLDMPNINPSLPIVRVSGDSMTPKIPNGSYISIREISDPSIIMWGNIYLVEMEDYRMVKVLRRSHSDPSSIILHSYNSDYDDIEVPRSAIHRLFVVESVICCDALV